MDDLKRKTDESNQIFLIYAYCDFRGVRRCSDDPTCPRRIRSRRLLRGLLPLGQRGRSRTRSGRSDSPDLHGYAYQRHRRHHGSGDRYRQQAEIFSASEISFDDGDGNDLPGLVPTMPKSAPLFPATFRSTTRNTPSFTVKRRRASASPSPGEMEPRNRRRRRNEG